MLIFIIILISTIIIGYFKPKHSKENDSLRKNLEELDRLEYNKIKEKIDNARK